MSVIDTVFLMNHRNSQLRSEIQTLSWREVWIENIHAQNYHRKTSYVYPHCPDRKFECNLAVKSALAKHISINILALWYLQDYEVRMTVAKSQIGSRFKSLRESSKLTQSELATQLGFSDRQTLSNIENGVRRVSAEELVRVAEIFQKPLEYFTDPFVLVGEGRFSWRATNEVDKECLDSYEEKAARWIAAYRFLAPRVDVKRPAFRHSLRLDRNSSNDDAYEAGERFVHEFSLGERPASNLVETMARKLEILVLNVDMPAEISGAACRLVDLDTVFIARTEREERRHFNLAHELFHILTWDVMPPEHVENELRFKTRTRRIETLANKFAAALLIPAKQVQLTVDWKACSTSTLIDRIESVAAAFLVSPSALRYRLIELGLISKTQREETSTVRFSYRRAHSRVGDHALLYSHKFIKVIALAIEKGIVTARSICNLLELSIEELNQLLEEHGIGPRIAL